MEFDRIADVAFARIDICCNATGRYVDEFNEWIASDILDIVSQFRQNLIIFDFPIEEFSHFLMSRIHFDFEIYNELC
jgi:hypothetical protein